MRSGIFIMGGLFNFKVAVCCANSTVYILGNCNHACMQTTEQVLTYCTALCLAEIIWQCWAPHDCKATYMWSVWVALSSTHTSLAHQNRERCTLSHHHVSNWVQCTHELAFRLQLSFGHKSQKTSKLQWWYAFDVSQLSVRYEYLLLAHLAKARR